MTGQADRAGGDGLLPCPCCGVASVGVEHDRNIFAGQTYPGHPNSDGWKLRCDGCGNQTAWWHSEADARKAWNTRAAPPSGNAGETRQFQTSRGTVELSVAVDAGLAAILDAAPPQPAPDAVREDELKQEEKTILDFFDNAENADLADDTWSLNATDARKALNTILEAALSSAPVPSGTDEQRDAIAWVKLESPLTEREILEKSP